MDPQIDWFAHVGDAMHERIVWRLRSAQPFYIGAQILDVGSPLGAQLPLESPTAKREESWLRVARLRRIESILQIALEDVSPQILAIDRQVLQLEAATGTEIVVRHEVAWKLRRLFFLRTGQRLRGDDVVLLLEFLLREHHVDDEGL